MGRNNKAKFHWDDALIECELRKAISIFGRMPSANELSAAAIGSLANAISRSHGYYEWSLRMEVEQKGAETHFGQYWERHEMDWFKSLGMNTVRQTALAPFDFLVGSLRVDVKASGDYRSYTAPSGSVCSGYFFGGLKAGEACDVFDLLCTEGNKLVCRFIIPASEAKVHNLTITPASLHGTGKIGKYRKFKDAVWHITCKPAP